MRNHVFVILISSLLFNIPCFSFANDLGNRIASNAVHVRYDKCRIASGLPLSSEEITRFKQGNNSGFEVVDAPGGFCGAHFTQQDSYQGRVNVECHDFSSQRVIDRFSFIVILKSNQLYFR